MSASICRGFRPLSALSVPAVLLLLAGCLLTGKARSQELENTKISLQLKQASLKEAIQIIEALTPFKFVASAEDIEGGSGITLNVKNQPLSKVLSDLLKGRGLQYKQVKQTIILKKDPVPKNTSSLIIPVVAKSAEKYTISGTVK